MTGDSVEDMQKSTFIDRIAGRSGPHWWGSVVKIEDELKMPQCVAVVTVVALFALSVYSMVKHGIQAAGYSPLRGNLDGEVRMESTYEGAAKEGCHRKTGRGHYVPPSQVLLHTKLMRPDKQC